MMSHRLFMLEGVFLSTTIVKIIITVTIYHHHLHSHHHFQHQHHNHHHQRFRFWKFDRCTMHGVGIRSMSDRYSLYARCTIVGCMNDEPSVVHAGRGWMGHRSGGGASLVRACYLSDAPIAVLSKARLFSLCVDS